MRIAFNKPKRKSAIYRDGTQTPYRTAVGDKKPPFATTSLVVTRGHGPRLRPQLKFAPFTWRVDGDQTKQVDQKDKKIGKDTKTKDRPEKLDKKRPEVQNTYVKKYLTSATALRTMPSIRFSNFIH